jgi:endonuclease/exonuclease/phosphatase family metal-dependent hydrolase
MKILSWNILATEWIKSSYYQEVNKNVIFNRAARFTQICAILRQQQPDIILLQEVMPQEYAGLQNCLHSKFYISPMNPLKWGKPKSKSGNVTIIRKSLLQKREIIHHSFDFGIYSICHLSAGGGAGDDKSLHIINLHLDDISLETRKQQMAALKPFYDTAKQCIIGGDFNHQYKATCPLYKLPGFHVHNFCPTYYIEKKMNIDNILTKGFSLGKEAHCPVYPATMEAGFKMFGSDHLPVQALIRLPK